MSGVVSYKHLDTHTHIHTHPSLYSINQVQRLVLQYYKRTKRNKHTNTRTPNQTLLIPISFPSLTFPLLQPSTEFRNHNHKKKIGWNASLALSVYRSRQKVPPKPLFWCGSFSCTSLTNLIIHVHQFHVPVSVCACAALPDPHPR